ERPVDPDPDMFDSGQPRGQLTQLRRAHHRIDFLVLEAQPFQALQWSVAVLRAHRAGFGVAKCRAQAFESAPADHRDEVELEKTLAAVLFDLALVDAHGFTWSAPNQTLTASGQPPCISVSYRPVPLSRCRAISGINQSFDKAFELTVERT